MDYKIMYEQAIKRAKAMISVAANQEEVYNGVITIFPELKESEDERIRKDLLGYLHTLPNHFSHNGSLVTEWIAWLEKQGEKNPTDKVEPKFKFGDWIIDVQGVSANQIIGYEDDSYYIETSCSKFYLPMKLTEKNYRPWTIQDAKDGDVLASKDGGDILIFRNIEDNLSFSSYYNIEGKNEHYWAKSCFIPATKEQRDLLFQKMKEAGYEWDAEKKELKKIEQKDDDDMPF